MTYSRVGKSDLISHDLQYWYYDSNKGANNSSFEDNFIIFGHFHSPKPHEFSC